MHLPARLSFLAVLAVSRGAVSVMVVIGLWLSLPAAAAEKPDCSRLWTLALHDHGLLYSGRTGTGIDRDVANELIRRSGCKVNVSLLPRARIWQLVESGALDFSLSGISTPERERFAGFAWYYSNKYYLLLRKDAGVQSLAEAEASETLQLGAIRGFRYCEQGNRLVDRLDPHGRVSYAQSMEPLFQILQEDRIQAMLVEPVDFPEIERAALRERTTMLAFDDPAVPHGLIISKASVPAPQQEAWRALMTSMREDGTVLRIFEKYFNPEMARTLTRF